MWVEEISFSGIYFLFKDSAIIVPEKKIFIPSGEISFSHTDTYDGFY